MFRSITILLNLAKSVCSLASLAIMLFFHLATAQAGQVTLAWDANTESTLGGYRLYYGQASGNYTSNIDVGNKTTYTLAGLQDGATYYFALKSSPFKVFQYIVK